MTRSARELLSQFSLSGTVSGLLMSTVVGIVSRLTRGQSGQGLNAISHILWGAKAAQQPAWTLRYTATGLVLNQVACLFWAGCYEVLRQTNRPHRVTTSAADAMAIAALAYVADYHLIPKRFTPGFEWVFSSTLFSLLYLGLADSLLAGSACGGRTPRASAKNETPGALN